MPRIRDQEKAIVAKILDLQDQLQTKFKRVSAFVYQSNTGIEVKGTKSVVQFLKAVKGSGGRSVSSVCEEAALREALAGIEDEGDHESHADRTRNNKKLLVPLSLSSYDEMKKWLIEDLKAEATEKGFGAINKNNMYNFDRTSATSRAEHERRMPDQWPQHMIDWSDVSSGISALGSNFPKITKSAACPLKPLEFFRKFISARLQASGLDPERHFSDSALSEKRRRFRMRTAHPENTTQASQPEPARQDIESRRPSPEQLARSDSETSTTSINDNITRPARQDIESQRPSPEQLTRSDGDTSINGNITRENSSNDNSINDTSRDGLHCHICSFEIEIEEDPIRCDCATRESNLYVHWACVRDRGCTNVLSVRDAGICHICKETVTCEDTQDGNILLCHCDTNDETFVHYECLKAHGCKK